MWWDPLGAVPRLRAWLWAGLALLVVALQGPAFVHSLRPDRRTGVDFFQEWASAKNYRTGLPIYAPHSQTIPRYLGLDVEGLSPDAVRVRIDVNAHPPASVLLAIPFASLDYPDAVLAWNLASLGLFAISVAALARALGAPWSVWSVAPAAVLLLLCSPFRQQVGQGQLNLVLLSLLTAAWLADRSGKSVWAGAAVGAATAVKLFPGFLGLYFVLRRDWKALAAFALALACVSAVSLAAMGIDSHVAYVRDVLPKVGAYRSSWLNASLVGFFTRLFDPATAQERVEPLWRSPALAMLSSLIALLAVAVLWAVEVARAQSQDARDRAFAMGITAMLLVSPITWDHYFMLLALPLALAWRDATTTARRMALLAIATILFTNPTLVWNPLIGATDTAGPGESLLLLAAPTYALVGLYWLLADRGCDHTNLVRPG
jgi:hypothetical protein